MESEALQRIAALEAEVAQLRREAAAERESGESATGEGASSAEVTRRRVLRGGGLAALGAAGAAGAVAGPLASPASAQEPVDAADVGFDAIGDIQSTNVQDALAEVDEEKAALAGANFSGSVTMLSANTLAGPWFDVRAHGAVGDGSSDDTEAIRNAINAAESFGGGTVLVPPGKYRFFGEVLVPSGVDIWGGGGHRQGGSQTGTIQGSVRDLCWSGSRPYDAGLEPHRNL